MKKVLLIVANREKLDQESTKFVLDGLLARKDDNISFDITSFDGLSMLVDKDNSYIKDLGKGFDVADFDLVVFRTVGESAEEAAAVDAYCRKKGIKKIDRSLVPLVSRKLNCAFDRWAAGLNVPITAYGPIEGLEMALERIGLPAVLKATNGRRGQDNYLIKTVEELREIVAQNLDKKFVLQNFIPNDGDYRILVLNYGRVVVDLRQRQGDTHLNNASAGGTETIVEDTAGLEDAIELAKKAAKLDGLEIAGVDIIIDKDTTVPYVLEVNRAPQLTLPEEIDGYYKAIVEIANE